MSDEALNVFTGACQLFMAVLTLVNSMTLVKIHEELKFKFAPSRD